MSLFFQLHGGYNRELLTGCNLVSSFTTEKARFKIKPALQIIGSQPSTVNFRYLTDTRIIQNKDFLLVVMPRTVSFLNSRVPLYHCCIVPR